MALWAKAQQLPLESLEQIRAIYGDHFPIEVRHYLAQYIEEKFWSEIEPEPDNPQHEQYVATLINDLIIEIENRATMVNDPESFLAKLKLAEAAKMFRQRYSLRSDPNSVNPMQLFNYIRQCLATELRLIQVHDNGEGLQGLPSIMVTNSETEIHHQIDILRRKTQQTAAELNQMEQDQETIALQFHECAKINAALQQHDAINVQHMTQQEKVVFQEKRKLLIESQTQINQKITCVIQTRMSFNERMKETLRLLSQLQLRILDDELIKWKREQQLAGNGATFNSNLDTIQEWCESLADLIWKNRQQLKEADRLKLKLPLEAAGFNDVLAQLLTEVTQLLSSLVTSTFIIEKQPPQVLKTNTRFTATVRLLVGGCLNVHMSPPQVKVTIISEAHANLLLQNEKLSKNGDTSGDILNNTGTMEYQQATRQLSVSFRNMQLKKIRRAEKKGTESVMDEKFSLLFQSQFSVGGGELVFQVWTLSLPCVAIVHGNQEQHAWATITWDNAFSDPGRIPFAVPDKVLWSSMADTLSLKFRAATGRGLTEDNLRFLADKVFRGNYNDSPNTMISWAQFSKEQLTERNFTFWEWFYNIMKLTREHLRSLWVDGAIMGFVRKKQAEEMLSPCTLGTFLLRYSDSELGGITIAWVSDNSEVLSLQPFTAKDFSIRTLPDRISDLHHLTFLFPNTTKELIFGKYYTPITENQPTGNGYVKPLLVTHIPGISCSTYPNTPQHSFVQSPDTIRETPSVASSYSGSISTSTTAAGGPASVDYFGQLDDCNIDQFVNFNDLMQGYKQ